MSVINRMLQDIDRRRSEAGVGAPALHPDIHRVVRRSRAPASSSKWAWILALLAIGCTLAALAWIRWGAPSPPGIEVATATKITLTPPPTPPPAAAPVPAPALLPESSSTPAAETVPAVAAEATATPIGAALEKMAPAPLLAKSLASVPTAPPRTQSERLKMSMQLSMLVADAPPAPAPAPATATSKRAPVASVAPAAPGTTTITNTPIRQVATDETLAVARTLWANGARTDAMATLREALAAAESARSQRSIAALARELARLEVADNRPQSALDLLRRLEGTLVDDADAWALRGNAEQRLGLHADAAQSYLGALRLKPSEGKWMLGAAISLAAAGRMDEAQSWVEKARERDAVTPTIASYLLQLGIAPRR